MDHNALEKIQQFEEKWAAAINARFFFIIIKNRQIKMSSQGWKNTKLLVIWEWKLSGCYSNKKIKLGLKDFLRKFSLKNDTMKEIDLQKKCNYPINPRDFKRYLDKGFIIFDKFTLGGSHWIAFRIKIKTNHFILTGFVVMLINLIRWFLLFILLLPNRKNGQLWFGFIYMFWITRRQWLCLEALQEILKNLHTSISVQKPDLSAEFLESIFQEDIDKKNQFENKNLPNQISIKDSTSNLYIDKFWGS